MISMVWPFIVLTMSPGPLRVAVGHVLDDADGADRVDLGLARRERVHQPDHAGRARHVALHVLHAGGGLDRNAAGVEGHALADEGDRRVVLLAAVPAHDDDAAVLARSLPDAEQRVHAEFLHRRHVEHLDRDAELLEHGRPAGEFLREEHVGRLVDQVAGHDHAVGDRLRCVESQAFVRRSRHCRPRS